MFSINNYFKIWSVTDKGNYAEVNCSTSKKNRQTGKYETDFSAKFVRFVGEAYKKRPVANEQIKVTSCGVQNVYEKDGQKQYLKNPTFIVFDFVREGNNGGASAPSPIVGGNGGFEEIGDSDGLPF